uniref:Uncharacterized protein n=1 Tax=Triticum urartu TaxID=4572 RepID=A0A8R7PIC3_TRIUA
MLPAPPIISSNADRRPESRGSPRAAADARRGRCRARVAVRRAAAAGRRPHRRRHHGGRGGVLQREAPADGRHVPALAPGQPVRRRRQRVAVPLRQPQPARRPSLRRVLRAPGARRARPCCRRAPPRRPRQYGQPLGRLRRARGERRRLPHRVAGARAHVLRPGPARRHGAAPGPRHGRGHPRQLLHGGPGAPARGRAALHGGVAQRQRRRDGRAGRDQHLPPEGPRPRRARPGRRRRRRRGGGGRGGEQVEAGVVRRGAGRGRHGAAGARPRRDAERPAAQIGDGGDGAAGVRGGGAARGHGRPRPCAVSVRVAHHAGRAGERVPCHLVTQTSAHLEQRNSSI